MTTSRNNTIMSWMAYTEFFYPGCELQPGYFYLSIPELYYIPEDGACIGAAGVDAYLVRNAVTQNSPDIRVSGLFAPQDAQYRGYPV